MVVMMMMMITVMLIGSVDSSKEKQVQVGGIDVDLLNLVHISLGGHSEGCSSNSTRCCSNHGDDNNGLDIDVNLGGINLGVDLGLGLGLGVDVDVDADVDLGLDVDLLGLLEVHLGVDLNIGGNIVFDSDFCGDVGLASRLFQTRLLPIDTCRFLYLEVRLGDGSVPECAPPTKPNDPFYLEYRTVTQDGQPGPWILIDVLLAKDFSASVFLNYARLLPIFHQERSDIQIQLQLRQTRRSCRGNPPARVWIIRAALLLPCNFASIVTDLLSSILPGDGIGGLLPNLPLPIHLAK